MNCYFLKETPSKAREDVDEIMRGMGFKNIAFKRPSVDNKVLDFFVTFSGAGKAVFSLHKGDVLVLPYNLRKYYIYLCKVAHMKGAKVVTLIHDLSSFYRKKVLPKDEIARLSHSDYVIAHNQVMKKWLEDNGLKRPVGVLEIFDYLSIKQPVEKPLPEKPYKVLYAGTLNPQKNNYLYQLEDTIRDYKFVLYGKGFDSEIINKKDHFIYKGFTPSDELVSNPEGDFGLVWDGNSIEICDGPRGAYMKYNNPHKFSLYVRCEIPVIIWEQAALANFTRENNIGICISSLNELNEILSAITPEEYRQMKQNIQKVSKRLAEGYYFKKAFAEALEKIK